MLARRWQSGQLHQTVNLTPLGLRGFKSLPAHTSEARSAQEEARVRFREGFEARLSIFCERSETKYPRGVELRILGEIQRRNERRRVSRGRKIFQQKIFVA